MPETYYPNEASVVLIPAGKVATDKGPTLVCISFDVESDMIFQWCAAVDWESDNIVAWRTWLKTKVLERRHDIGYLRDRSIKMLLPKELKNTGSFI